MQVTEDLDEFLTRAGDVLRSRPAHHTMPLTTVEKLRKRGTDGTTFGWVDGEAIFYRRPTGRLTITHLPPGRADDLAGYLAGHPLSGVIADDETATAFAEAWQRHTGATAVPGVRVLLHRLGELTPPEPVPDGRGRALGEQDVIRWCGEFAAAVGETFGSWAGSRFADKRYTFWEAEVPVAMAGSTSMVAGMVRVDPVYTPARFRGRGYGGAVTVEVSRAALDAGATDVVLFTDPANVTSNALYQRIGYVPIAGFSGYDFS